MGNFIKTVLLTSVSFSILEASNINNGMPVPSSSQEVSQYSASNESVSLSTEQSSMQSSSTITMKDVHNLDAEIGADMDNLRCERLIMDKLNPAGLTDDIKQKVSRLINMLNALVENNNTDAMLMLSDIYLDGDMVKTDYQKSRELLEKAIELGSTNAITCLAFLYENGYGVEKNTEKASELYLQAYTNGDSSAIIGIYRINPDKAFKIAKKH